MSGKWVLITLGIAGCGGGGTESLGDGGAPPTGPALMNPAGTDGSPLATTLPIGRPCTPLSESSAAFAGFNYRDVSLEENDPACGGKVCLVNHFQGRTTCPYGQDASGRAPPPASPCTVPGTGQPVAPNDPASMNTVEPQCLDRLAASTVYCSCRCANAQGLTGDGAGYCACPQGFACTQLVTEILPGDPTAGAYCVKDGTALDPNNVCSGECFPSPTFQPCP